MIVGLAVAMPAQKHRDQKKPPPKPPAPVINPGEGKRPKPTPRQDGKKPKQNFAMTVWKEVETV